MQVGSLVGEGAVVLFRVAVAGGLRDAGVAGQAVCAVALAVSAQCQNLCRNGPSVRVRLGVSVRRRWAASGRAKCSSAWGGTLSVTVWVTDVKPLVAIGCGLVVGPVLPGVLWLPGVVRRAGSEWDEACRCRFEPAGIEVERP